MDESLSRAEEKEERIKGNIRAQKEAGVALLLSYKVDLRA